MTCVEAEQLGAGVRVGMHCVAVAGVIAVVRGAVCSERSLKRGK